MTDQGKIVEGLSYTLLERQQRWDRIQDWTVDGRSLAEIVELEEAASGGLRLSRERIRAIKDKPRPGSVGRPRLPGLRAAVREWEGRVATWRRKPKSDFQAERLQDAKNQLAEARRALRAEERAAAKKVVPGAAELTVGNYLYSAFRDAMLAQPESAVFYKDVERPCWHSRLLRFREWLRGHSHARTHVVAEPFSFVRLSDGASYVPADGSTDDTVTMHVNVDGTFWLD